jgi:hypothetical protein
VLPTRLLQLDGVAGVGVVNVTRQFIGDNQGGYTWSVTFTTAIGDIAQMTVTSYLTGLLGNLQRPCDIISFYRRVES